MAAQKKSTVKFSILHRGGIYLDWIHIVRYGNKSRLLLFNEVGHMIDAILDDYRLLLCSCVPSFRLLLS